ncbi:hypothetical protein H2203_008520 [Taxawa tesnikishii (nom. ined.)]|nr:hypothetical protein H2203_008520 [Dothideales sp. JES 119]
MARDDATTLAGSKPSKTISPAKLAHVVLRTAKFDEMVKFYTTFLGAHVVYENGYLAFLTYDNEHHRIAIASFPGTSPKVQGSSGLEHIAFTFNTLEDLMVSWRQRKELGIEPVWCTNHGPTVSIYYKDPDGNMLETQVDAYETPEEATEFMRSEEFAQNPIGVDFDPEEFEKRVLAKEDFKVLTKRANIGVRGLT